MQGMLNSQRDLSSHQGFVYFGARYYDPRVSVWQSPDPILGQYLPTVRGQVLNKLKGDGGIYNSKNISMYSYAHGNPIVAKDPDGKHAIWAHKSILEAALQGKYAVSDHAMQVFKSGTANADKCEGCQGNRAQQANLHGMAGFAGEGDNQTMQTKSEAIKGTQAAIDNKIAEAVTLATKGKYDEAIESLSSATHAAQDADQHGYEEWGYSGIGSFIAHNPIGAIVHWIEDNWLGGEEKARNVELTQGVMDKFREKAGNDIADKTLNYEKAD